MSYIGFPSNPPPLFPTLPVIGFPVHKKPYFATWEHKAVSGQAYQTARQVYPNWDFELQVADDAWFREQTQNNPLYSPNAPYTELEAVSQLFLSCFGAYGEFWYDDPEDNSSAGQLIGDGTGSWTSFLIMRAWGTDTLSRIEPVGGVNLGATTNVYLNGGSPISPTLYTVTNDLTGSHVNFTTAPSNGVAVTMDFSYYFRCRFKEDNQQYDQFMMNLWQARKIEFRSVKP